MRFFPQCSRGSIFSHFPQNFNPHSAAFAGAFAFGDSGLGQIAPTCGEFFPCYHAHSECPNGRGTKKLCRI